MARNSRIDPSGSDDDHQRQNSDYIIADGSVQTAQGSVYGVVVGKGSRQYPHEPHDYARSPVQNDYGMLAYDPGHKWCMGCAGWKARERFNADPSAHDGLFYLCADDQRRLRPDTLGLKYCKGCSEWLEPSLFSSGSTMCRVHEAERQRVRRRGVVVSGKRT